MKFGASVWPFHRDPPYDDGAKRIAALGLVCVGRWNPIRTVEPNAQPLYWLLGARLVLTS
jgi:hypothetical protein